ncbi:MAG: hypothetical protein JO280_19920 [Mycobacteriaceae bacterium]|nr:hypothetical protein [Mycobacteriaceae bacterium]
MNIKQLVAGGALACAVGLIPIGVGAGVASAAPCWPGAQGQCGPGRPEGPAQDFRAAPGDWGRQWNPGDNGRQWNPGDNDWRGRFRGAPWGDGLPPWGWGAPPAPLWGGPPAWGQPAAPINYWGYNEQPIFDPGYNQWGFWFFGIWIPLPF